MHVAILEKKHPQPGGGQQQLGGVTYLENVLPPLCVAPDKSWSWPFSHAQEVRDIVALQDFVFAYLDRKISAGSRAVHCQGKGRRHIAVLGEDGPSSMVDMKLAFFRRWWNICLAWMSWS